VAKCVKFFVTVREWTPLVVHCIAHCELRTACIRLQPVLDFCVLRMRVCLYQLSVHMIVVKNVFDIFFQTRVFNVFLNVFLLSIGHILILLNLQNSEIKRLLSERLETADIGNSLTKSQDCQTLSCTVRQ